jgi:adhesin/invasin
MNYRAVAFLLCLVSLLPVAGCDKATPVAPSGTILTISASPSQISLTGTSKITVIGRKPDGNPLNPGTEIRLTVDKGTINPTVVQVDSSGAGTATFRGDGRPGVAKVTAATGGGDAKAEADIQVGQSTESKPTVLLSVNPATIPVNGSATVTVVGRNADGSPASGQQVILTSTLGTLGNARLTTRSDGTASTTLTAGAQAGTATVTAVLGSSDLATSTVEVRAAILTLTADRTAIPEQATTVITITATVTAFQGDPIQNKPVTFRADRGVLSATTVNTDANGNATVRLTVTTSSIDADQTFQVTATTPSGAGDPLTATLNITVENTVK